MISYHFTEKYGELQTEYLAPHNFDYIHHSKQVKRLVDSLSKTIAMPSHYRYIAHHARKYHNVMRIITVVINRMIPPQKLNEGVVPVL